MLIFFALSNKGLSGIGSTFNLEASDGCLWSLLDNVPAVPAEPAVPSDATGVSLPGNDAIAVFNSSVLSNNVFSALLILSV